MRWFGALVAMVAFTGCTVVGVGDSGLPFDTGSPDTTRCSTGQEWSHGNQGSSSMKPGSDCLACHSFSVAGTVQGALDDADDCMGLGGVQVRVTDARGTVHSMTTNSAGNFWSRDVIPTPYQVEIEYQGQITAMNSDVTDGGCGACHTSTGDAGAPGRVTP